MREVCFLQSEGGITLRETSYSGLKAMFPATEYHLYFAKMDFFCWLGEYKLGLFLQWWLFGWFKMAFLLSMKGLLLSLLVCWVRCVFWVNLFLTTKKKRTISRQNNKGNHHRGQALSVIFFLKFHSIVSIVFLCCITKSFILLRKSQICFSFIVKFHPPPPSCVKIYSNFFFDLTYGLV